MKKQLVLVAGLAVLATPAIASKARLQALGESVDGSFYINDNRNIFLNASEVLNHKDMVTFEWGAGTGGTTSNGTTNSDTAAQAAAEGGFLRAAGNMVWGAQLGRVTSFAQDYQTMAANGGIGAAADLYAPSNALDLFIGGDAGVKWGVQGTYISQKDDAHNGANQTAKANQIDLAAGVSSGNIAGYVKYGASGKITQDSNDASIKRKTPIELGVSYKWMEYTLFGQYNTVKYDTEVATAQSDVKKSSWQVGVGRSSKLSDKATLFTKLYYTQMKTDFDGLNSNNKNETKALPAVVGLEYDAASWLVLRGSVQQNIIIGEQKVNGNKSTVLNSTDVNAGATFKFGDLSVDGVLGTNNGTGATRSTHNGETGILNTDNLISRVSMTYRF